MCGWIYAVVNSFSQEMVPVCDAPPPQEAVGSNDFEQFLSSLQRSL